MRIPAGLTDRGRCLLAGGGATAVCAVILDERDLLRAGAFVALLPVLALLLAVHTRWTVRVQRELDPARLTVGGPATVRLRVHGGGLAGALRLADTVPDAAGPTPEAPPRFIASGRAGPGVLDYPLRPVLRGVHGIGPLRGHATDPLGLAEFSTELAAVDRLVVLPRVVPLSGLPPALGAGDGTPGAALAHRGQGASDVLVRPYRRGDELRRVHWRSTARHDELMVRLEERPWRGGTTVLLDRRDAAHRGRGADSSLEFAVSLAASACVHLITRGEPVDLVTEDGAEVTGPAGPGGRQESLLDALAALRPSTRTDLGGPDLGADRSVLAVLGDVDTGGLEALLARRAGGGGLAVLLDTATWDPTTRDPTTRDPTTRDPTTRDPTTRDPTTRDRTTQDPTTRDPTTRGTAGAAAGPAAVLRRAGWRVVVAGAGSTPGAVWAELVSGAAPDAGRAGAP